MNTYLCDMEDSELADSIGPFLCQWAKEVWDFPHTYHYKNRALWSGNDAWCVSEMLNAFALQRTKRNFDELPWHDDCRWQRP